MAPSDLIALLKLFLIDDKRVNVQRIGRHENRHLIDYLLSVESGFCVWVHVDNVACGENC